MMDYYKMVNTIADYEVQYVFHDFWCQIAIVALLATIDSWCMPGCGLDGDLRRGCSPILDADDE